jgi:uncharacterized repeat protein (TIGR01451 family)
VVGCARDNEKEGIIRRGKRSKTVSLRRGGLLLLAASLAFLLPAPPTSGYGELNFNQNLTTSSNNIPISTASSGAQSFVPWESFLLSRVSLYLYNDPPTGDPLNVTIQSDAGSAPSGTVLGWSEFVYTGTGWRVFPITPALPLAQGVTYWIVADSREAPGAGYDWRHSGGDVVPGQGLRDTGSGWTFISQDLTYQTYGLRLEPYFTLDLDGDRPYVAPGDVETFTVFLNNTGSRTPLGAWLNLTFPAAMTYEADTAGPLGGVRNGTSWYFPGLGNGAHTFSVAVSVGTTTNRYMNTTARFDYTDSAGVRLPPRSETFSAQATEVAVPPTNDPPSLWFLWLLPLAIGLVPVAAYGYKKTRTPEIEELFVVHTSGVLLYHLGRSMKTADDKDKDVLGSMFTVVQDFVKDSFRYGGDRELNKLEFGDYKILIERGPNLYLAIASSSDVEQLSNRARHAVAEIEQKFGTELAQFSGRMEPVLGIRDLVKKHLRLS